ncbi:DMP19 family protein [Asticcacaulis sp.]|uniref:DMP19 family protein n=1 Tax=Asticcacaulis sp. TaxID=1872648 RepID=UPI003F7C4566
MNDTFTDEQMRMFLLGTAERTDLDLWTTSVAKMSGPRQIFVLIWELESEVCNGGFWQYAYNGSGEGAPFVLGALKAIKANATFEIVSEALEIIGNKPWHDWDARQAAIEAMDQEIRDKLEPLDQRFFAYEDNLSALLFQYIVDNIGAFPPPKS